MKIKMNACPCGERTFEIEHTDLVSACGYLECEICGAPVLPVDANGAAVEAACDMMKADGRLNWKPSEWVDTLTARRDAILAEWAEVQTKLNEKHQEDSEERKCLVSQCS